jgi:hypothetical protein
MRYRLTPTMVFIAASLALIAPATDAEAATWYQWTTGGTGAGSTQPTALATATAVPIGGNAIISAVEDARAERGSVSWVPSGLESNYGPSGHPASGPLPSRFPPYGQPGPP